MSNESIIATLTKLAEANESRLEFNRAVAAAFPCMLGEGGFRKVYDAGEVVIKLRRDLPKYDNTFPMRAINIANREEGEGYESFAKENPRFAHFVLKPTYVTLPNKHDVVLMEKVDFVWGEVDEWTGMGQDEYAQLNPEIHNQIQVIQEVFQDGHDGNVGIKGNRAYLIDFNFTGTWWDSLKIHNLRARQVLEAVGVKFRGRKPKARPMVMEAGA
jgi:hypothetical protein